MWLATDLDREGESIAWHIAEYAGLDADQIRRVTFSEITKGAIDEAFANPRSINLDLVNAQQARRVIDRLVGYKLSPLVSSKIRRGLSAGRVQSVAVRLVVDREREIDAFVPEEYWTLLAQLRRRRQRGELRRGADPHRRREGAHRLRRGGAAARGGAAGRHLHGQQGHPQPAEEERAAAVHHQHAAAGGVAQAELRGASHHERGAVAVRGHRAAGGPGRPDHVHAHRLGGHRLRCGRARRARWWASATAPSSCRRRPNAYRTQTRGAQEAHEAIRPSSFARTPESLSGHLKPDELRLYDLIWKRALASQMAPARFDQVGVDVSADRYTLHAGARKRIFDGYQALYVEGKDDEEDERLTILPDLQDGEALDLIGLSSEQHFTQPPPRFTEATLIRRWRNAASGGRRPTRPPSRRSGSAAT